MVADMQHPSAFNVSHFHPGRRRFVAAMEMAFGGSLASTQKL
jgi:hypothetical protein